MVENENSKKREPSYSFESLVIVNYNCTNEIQKNLVHRLTGKAFTRSMNNYPTDTIVIETYKSESSASRMVYVDSSNPSPLG
jgi:hypothetical protein